MENIEIWKDIPEYEGLYQVSTFGRVKSLPRNGAKGGILKSAKKKQKNYLSVILSKNNKRKNILVHRLVALAFIPNPENLPYINHKDENPSNNYVNNLEWCTHEYNVNYGTRNERVSKAMKGKPRHKGENNPFYGKQHTEESKKKLSKAMKGKYKGENNPFYGKQHTEKSKKKMSEAKKGKGTKPILQYTKDMVFIRVWDSATQVEKELNIKSTNICMCCKGKIKTAKGFIWRYKNVA